MSKFKVINFSIDNLDIEKIHSKYNINDYNTLASNIEILNNNTTTTKLSELNNNNEKNIPNIVSFLDETKKTHNCFISMIDWQSKLDVNLLRYHCFWCRNPFNTLPLGCPINYKPCQAMKKYYSNISKDTYTIKEDITSQRKELLDDNINLTQKHYFYETDGIFCSFNCCQAFINDSKHNKLYDNSTILLLKIYNDLMNTKLKIIFPAPHWRTLEHYGGHLNILQFRDGFNKIDYEYHGITRTIPIFASVGMLYEEKIKF